MFLLSRLSYLIYIFLSVLVLNQFIKFETTDPAAPPYLVHVPPQISNQQTFYQHNQQYQQQQQQQIQKQVST